MLTPTYKNSFICPRVSCQKAHKYFIGEFVLLIPVNNELSKQSVSLRRVFVLPCLYNIIERRNDVSYLHRQWLVFCRYEYLSGKYLTFWPELHLICQS
nr:MAG TPA: Protein of unknown function (DUF2517) [Caudoviricetes sp.]